jgi:hypothetical protein
VEAEREKERERGGPWHGVEQHNGVASARQWPGRGTRGRRVAAQQWRTAGPARRGSTWLTGGPGRDGGPVVSGWVWRGEAVGMALTGGVGNTVRPIQFSNRIKLISNGFKFALNFDRSKRCIPVLQKFQIKYG